MTRWRHGITALAVLTIVVVIAAVARRPAARECLVLARRARAEWRLADALQHLKRARLLDADLSAARIEEGSILVLRGEFDAAIRTLRAADTALLRGADRARHGVALGTALFQSNEADAALAAHGTALQHARRSGDRRLEADALVGISRVLYHLKGRPDEARRNLEQALAIGRQVGDPRIEADAIRHLGVIRWWFEGERQKSIIDFCEVALASYRRANDRHGEAVVLNNIGLMHGSRHDLAAAMRFVTDSLRIKEQIGDAAGMVDSWSVLGDLYGNARNHRKARELYLRGAEVARKIGYRIAQNEIENKLADIYVTIGELDSAVALFETLAERERDSPLMLKYRTGYLAELHQLRGDGERALALAQRTAAMDSETQSSPGRERGFSYITWIKVADAYRLRGELTNAAGAMSRAESFAAPDELAVWRARGLYPAAVRAEILIARGLREDAMRGLTATADEDLRLITNLTTPAVLIEKPHLYDRVFRILLGPEGDPALAVRFLEQLRYRSLLDVIRQAPPDAKQDYSMVVDEALRGEGLVSRARPRSIDEIQHAIGAETAIVEYVVAGPDVFVIVIRRDSVHSLRLPIDGGALAVKTRLLRALLFEGTTASRQWLPVATDLRRVLIEPIESTRWIAGIQRIELVPWGVLRDLPFAALARRSSEKVHFLVEDYTLSWLRSASVSAEQHAPPADGVAVCFAKRRFEDKALPDLPHAEEEGRAIASRMKGILHLDSAATEDELRRVAPRARVIHFATHAVIEPEMPLLSRFLLTPSGSADGEVTVPELLGVEFRGALVSLGACRSGISNSWGGSDDGDFGRVGLVEAVLHAGAGSVVATLAPVTDRATSTFMRRFYEGGVPADPAQRLASTQRSLLSSHPKEWAAFVVWH